MALNRALIVTLGASLALMHAAPSFAGPVPGFRMAPGAVHPADPYSMARSGGLLNEWRFQRDWNPTSQNYVSALRFAQCVARFDPGIGRELLRTPIGARGDREALTRMAQRNRPCAAEQGMVSPILLRAALAETLIMSQPALRSSAPVEVVNVVGVPEVVDGFPLAAISRCQVHLAPALVADVLKSAPGEKSERVATEALFRQTPDCGASSLGRVTPTVARLALVDAAYRRSLPATTGRR